MSDTYLSGESAASTSREIPESASPVNPAGIDGIEFIEYATPNPQALGQVLELMGFRPVARHRSREVLLYRQGDMNVISTPMHVTRDRRAVRYAGHRGGRACACAMRPPPIGARSIAAPGPCRRMSR